MADELPIPPKPDRATRARWFRQLRKTNAVRDPVDGSVIVELPTTGRTWAPSRDHLAICIAETERRDAPDQRQAIIWKIKPLYTEEEWEELRRLGYALLDLSA